MRVAYVEALDLERVGLLQVGLGAGQIELQVAGHAAVPLSQVVDRAVALELAASIAATWTVMASDDRSLYVSCWGTGELKRYDVSHPRNPRETASVRIGGMVNPSPHPAAGPVNGGPQMVEVSRDGRRVYLTNSLYRSWDDQFYPDGIKGWLVKLDAGEDGSLTVDRTCSSSSALGGRPHQVRLEGGDASSDSCCFPNGA